MWALAVAATVSPGARAGAQQWSGMVDAGASMVRYDGFLSSGAALLSPVVRLEAPHASLLGRGSVLEYQSGRRTVQGALNADVFGPRVWRLLPQLRAEAATSAYDSLPRFSNALGGARLNLVAGDRGAWLGGAAGTHAFDHVSRPVTELALGGWTRFRDATVALSFTSSHAGDTLYSDVQSVARWTRGREDIDASSGVRFGGRGGGRGVYGEATVTHWVSRQLALVLAGGRYPSDPVRGSIPGRYVSLSVRIATNAFALTPRLHAARAADPPMEDGSPLGAPRAVVEARGAGGFVVRVHAPGARTAEVMGDFTDWRPLPLDAAGGGTFLTTLTLPPGTYRFNVRFDGGPWIVPAGIAAVDDGFGGQTGLLIAR